MKRNEHKAKSTRSVVGSWALLIAVLALAGTTALPTNYVIQRPGNAVNTLGDVETTDGTEVPLIQVHGAETYPTSGALDLTTVWVRGSREHRPTWLELATAWLSRSQAVRPLDEYFGPEETDEDIDARNAQMMTDSKADAAAAALAYLDYDINPELEAVAAEPGTPAEGVFESGDRIRTADGTEVHTLEDLRAAVAASKGAEMTVGVERGSEHLDLKVTPNQTGTEDHPVWQLGLYTKQNYTLPIDVELLLDNIGGPSAGMMFALGIIDTMTPGEMTGGKHIAGTGTIDGTGEVGPIGGIRQKLYGARDAGAEYFLAPVENCDEVIGHVPSGLQVIAVDTLIDSAAAVEQIGSGGSTDALPTCEVALQELSR